MTRPGAPLDEARVLRLELARRPLSLQVRRESRLLSPHTGRELREVHAWISTPDPEMHGWLARVLREEMDRPVRSLDDAGETTGRWLVSWNAYAEAGGLHTYTLILREEEELSLETLLVDGMELHPYEYRERMMGDGLALWAKLVGTEEELERVRAQVGSREALPVVRRGIHDRPREMRLGVAEWSVFDDRVKYRLVLMDAEMNEEMRLELARIEEENTRAALGYYESLLERLTDLLVTRGVLSGAEADALREEARTAPGTARRDFWRVADVDALP